MSRFPFAGIALIVACFALPARTPADLTAASSRRAAPDFTLKNQDQKEIKLSDYRGRTVVLAFFFQARTKG